jgi:Lon protease-like protein
MDLNALPLFPLGTVLFPGGWLPLQIFEVRYLDLMKRCERSGEPFGVVSLQSGQEVRRAPDAHGAPPAETFAPVGTLARLVHVAHPQAGLMFVVAQGAQRFTLKGAHQLPHGLWVGEVSLMADDAPAPLPDELAELGSRLRHVLPEMVQDDGLPALPEADDPCWHDAGWVANRWAERLPLRTPERQRLMSLDNPVWRLELVAEWLDSLARTHAEGQAPG